MGRVAVIFGGCGFFGMHVARALSDDPAYDRIVLADICEPRELRERVDYVRVDVREPIDLVLAGEVDVFNFAAVHTTPGHEDWEYFWTNVRGATEVCRFADRVNARQIVFTSSISVFGMPEQGVNDDTAPKPVSAYGRSKLLAEQIHEDWRRAGEGRRLIIARPAVTFGEGERGNFSRLSRLLRLGLFAYPGRKTTIKACAPIEDFAECLRFVGKANAAEIRFIYAYPERTSTEAINEAFHQAAGFRRPKIVVPHRLMMVGAWLFEVLARIGLRTSINRARIGKLVQSTNAYPSELVSRGWTFRLTLTEALRRWKAASEFE
jgi:GlcNAc-P-P-Und epimerase